MVQVPDVSNILPSSWAMPCLPFAGIQSGFFAVPRDRLDGVDRVRAGRPGLPDLDRLLLGDGGARSRRWPWPRRRACSRSSSRRSARTRCSSATRRARPGASCSSRRRGALISVSDAGITISNGQGATITMTGPPVTVNEGALEVI